MPLNLPAGWLDSQLSPDASAVLNEAQSAMNIWIDKSVNDLSAKITAQIDSTAKDLSGQIKQFTDQLATAQSDLDAILKNVSAINVNAANPAAIQKAVADTQDAITAVKSFLQQRQQQWTSVGSTLVSTAAGLAKGIAAV